MSEKTEHVLEKSIKVCKKKKYINALEKKSYVRKENFKNA